MSKFAAAIGAIVLLAGVFITYINNEVIDPDAAGARASEAIAEDAGLRAAIAPQIADSAGGLPIVGGVVDADTVESALETQAAADAFGEAVSSTVSDLTADNRPDPLQLNLAQVATESVTGISSSPLDLVTDQVSSLQIDLRGVDRLLDVLDLAGELEPLGIPLIVIGVLLLVAAVLLAGGLWEGLLAVGLSIGVVGCLGIAALVIGRTLLGSAFDDSSTRDAVVATWDALGGDLLMTIIIATVAGFVVALAALMLRGQRSDVDHVPPDGDPYRRRDEPLDPHSPEYQSQIGTEPYRRPSPPPPARSPRPRRPPPPPDDPGPPDQDFGRRRYS